MKNSLSGRRRQQAVRFEQLLQLQLRKFISDIMTMLDACGRKIAESSPVFGPEREAGFRHEKGIRQINVGDRVEHLEAPRVKNPGLKLLIEQSIGDNSREIGDRLQEFVYGVRILAVLASPVAVAQFVQ